MTQVLIGVSTAEMSRISVFYDYLMTMDRPDNTGFTYCHGQSPAKARNIIIEEALKNNFSHVLFVDDDVLLPPDTLTKLLAHNVDAVTGLYCMRNYPHQPIIFSEALENGHCKWHHLNGNNTGLIEIVACGLGCALVSNRLLMDVRDNYPYPVTLGELEPDGWCDDLSFWKRVRSLGYKIHCDTKAPAGHVANVVVWPDKIQEQWAITYDTFGKGRVSFPMPASELIAKR